MKKYKLIPRFYTIGIVNSIKPYFSIDFSVSGGLNNKLWIDITVFGQLLFKIIVMENDVRKTVYFELGLLNCVLHFDYKIKEKK